MSRDSRVSRKLKYTFGLDQFLSISIPNFSFHSNPYNKSFLNIVNQESSSQFFGRKICKGKKSLGEGEREEAVNCDCWEKESDF
jgi:hypothetical protein